MLNPLNVQMPDRVPVRRALLSLSDKSGLAELAEALINAGCELVSTGGTAKAIADAGFAVTPVEQITSFPEMMDGRVKTLHPNLFAGILGVRGIEEHAQAAATHDIGWIDMVVVNLYPFEETVARPDVTLAEAIENIDIGGPSLIRAAAKNHGYVSILTDASQYPAIIEELNSSEDGSLSLQTRKRLCCDAYTYTARYDAAISGFLQRQSEFADQESFAPSFSQAYVKQMDLRYGENPHQRAAYYRRAGAKSHLLGDIEQLQGKELSFNNLLDLEAARAIAREFEQAACVIIKHNNPCGVAVGTDAAGAYGKAFACDPVSAFGGILAFTTTVDKAAAEAVSKQFAEVIFAPSFTDEALQIFSSKENLRLLQGDDSVLKGVETRDVRQVAGGVLVQDVDSVITDRDQMDVATAAQPTDQQFADMQFAWKVMRHVKSNAIVYAKDGATVGIGAGQMSRVDSARIGVEKAKEHGLSLDGAVMASDAFFPFPDGLQIGIDAGVKAVIQPGGSVRDNEVVAAADTAGVAMLMTGRRHFRH